MEIIRPGYTRISEILNGLRDRSNIHPDVLQEKANIGTEVHDNIKEEKSDGIPMFEDFAVRHPMTGEVLRCEKRGLGYFRSFSVWDKVSNPEFIQMETRFYEEEYKLTGKIDALVRFPSRKSLYLVDWKTSSKEDLEIWKLQAHFYTYLLGQNGLSIRDFIWIHLKKDGKAPTEYHFCYNEDILSQCFEEAEKYFEEKARAKVLD